MINALVLSLRELLLLKGILCDVSASVARGVKVGQPLALGEPSCLLTVMFEIILEPMQNMLFALYSLHVHPSAQWEC